MWYDFLSGLLNISITGGIVILVVLAVRVFLCDAPKIFSYALWAAVLFRLLCPVSISSPVSIWNLLGSSAADSGKMDFVDEHVFRKSYPAAARLVPMADGWTGRVLQPDEVPVAAARLEPIAAGLSCVWIVGAAALLLYSVGRLRKLRKTLTGSIPLRDNIYLADHIASPFVMGLFRPKIYLPSSLPEAEQGYILLHEQYHIRRLDHVVRILAFLALCLHWFNPLVWLAFALSGKDMEMSCDEAVMRQTGGDIRAEYSRSLVGLATGKRILSGAPLAFGEGDTRDRVGNIMRYRKPGFRILFLAVLLSVAAGVCLATAPLTPPTIQNARTVTYYEDHSPLEEDTLESYSTFSDEAVAELTELLRTYRCTPYPMTMAFSQGSRKTAQIDGASGRSWPLLYSPGTFFLRIDCENGDFYLLVFEYYKNLHGLGHICGMKGEDDYQAILICFPAGGEPESAWRMECTFDNAYSEWIYNWRYNG